MQTIPFCPNYIQHIEIFRSSPKQQVFKLPCTKNSSAVYIFLTVLITCSLPKDYVNINYPLCSYTASHSN